MLLHLSDLMYVFSGEMLTVVLAKKNLNGLLYQIAFSRINLKRSLAVAACLPRLRFGIVSHDPQVSIKYILLQKLFGVKPLLTFNYIGTPQYGLMKKKMPENDVGANLCVQGLRGEARGIRASARFM